MCFPYSSVRKESACNAGDPGLVPWKKKKDPLEKEMATHFGHDLVTKPPPNHFNKSNLYFHRHHFQGLYIII